MENLLDDIDGLVAPGLSTETPDWCVNCQSLRQELKQLKEEHSQNFGRLKQKIINTDLLIKKFKTKCDDYDLQCKRTDEANKRADKYQRQCEILETQLKAALLDTEPLRKATASLEEELKVKKTENQTLSDRLIATEGAQRQYEHLAKANSVNVEKLESEKKELMKKIKLLDSGKINKETVKELRNEIIMLKKENDGLKKDNTNLITTEGKLEKKLQLANKHIEELNKSLNEKGKSPKIRRRNSPVKSPFHSPRFGRFSSPRKSPIIKRQQLVEPGTSHSVALPTEDIEKLVADDENIVDDTDDNESVCSVTWTFSPLTQCISPLPPSPACFGNQADVDGSDSDIADDLEQQLLHFNGDSKHSNEELETTLTLQSPEKSEGLGSDEVDINTVESSAKAADVDDNENICYSEMDKNVDSSDATVNEFIEMNEEVNVPKSHEDTRDKEKCDKKIDCGYREMEDFSDLVLSKNEKIGDAIVSPKSLKRGSSHSIKAEGNDNNINPIKSVTRAPAIRRSARIRSKLDSETSEAESDLDQKKKDVHPVSPPSNEKGESASCTEAPNALSKDLTESVSLNNAISNDAEKPMDSDVLEKSKVDHSDTSSLSSQSVKMENQVDSVLVKSKNDANNLSTTENIVHTCHPEKVDNVYKTKEKSSELLDGNEMEVREDVQTKIDVPKLVTKQTYLVRQEAVSVKAGPSHLFEDQQAMRGKRVGGKDKSKFGPHKFIPFQRSSAGTLSNEIEDLNYLNDYELLSREQDDDQDIQKPELSSKYKKKLRKKIRKNCKYRDRDSEFYEQNNMIMNLNQSYNTPCDTNVDGSNVDSELELSTNEKCFTNESTGSNSNTYVSSLECDLKETKEQHLSEKDKSVCLNNETDANTGKDEAAVTEVKMSVVEEVVNNGSVTCATSSKGLEASNTLHVPGNNSVDESDKISPARQLSTGFSVNSLSLERTSSTESSISLRSSPVKLFVLESGSCDTIVEDVEENSKTTKNHEQICTDKSDDKKVDESACNIIFGVEDILDDEHDNIVDTTEHQPHTSIELKCNEYFSNTPDGSVESDSYSSNPQIFTSYMKPGCSEYNSEIKVKSGDFSIMETGDKNPEICRRSENVAEQFANVEDDSSRSSCASFGTLGSDSPMSDMFLSRFDLLNPVSPLPPSPVRELEEKVDDELSKKLGNEENELTHEPLLSKAEKYFNNDNQDVCDKLCNNNTLDNSQESKTKGKALLKKMKSSAQTILSSSTSVNDNVKIESDSVHENLPEDGKLTHVKVENLKMSPLPGIISPVKSPVLKHNQTKLVNSSYNTGKKIKIERNIMNDCDKRIKTEEDDTIVITRSKLSMNGPNGNTSPVTMGSVAKKRTPCVKKSGNDKCLSSDVVPVRKSAIVENILRNKAKVSKDKNTTSTRPLSDRSKGNNSIHAENVNTPKDVKPNVRTMNARPDLEPKATPVINIDEKGDHNILEELPTGHDNLAFKKKTRVAHKPNTQPLKVQKVPIIDAPSLPPGRKRRSAEGVHNDTQEKKLCKQSSFRRQKNDSCVKKEDTKRMQTFLKSPESAENFVSMVTEVHGEGFAGNIILLSCLECIGRVMTDPLDIVFENCVTDAYVDLDTDFPFLSDVEKRAVYLICHLLDNKYLKKEKLMRNVWDTVLCRNLTVNVIGKMAQCRLFIALCVVQGDLELARLMLYQLVTCTHINFILFLVPVVSVWPEILRKNPADRPDSVVSHGLTLVLEELVTERLLFMEDELSKKILIILKKLCLWSGVCGNSELVLKTLFVKLHCTSDESVNDCAVFELTNALNLLCASKQWTWVKVNFIDRHGLQTASNKYTAKLIMKPISPKYMCAVLRVTSYVLNAHASTIRERDYQHVIRNWLLPILNYKPGNDQVLLWCLETLIEISPLYPSCLDMIQKWFHEVKNNISAELVARLEDLRTQYKQQFGLNCKPFVKS